MNLIYLYPTGNSAPTDVAFNILEYLSKNADKLHCDNIKVLVPKKNEKMKFGLETINLDDLKLEKEKCLIHIPQSMLIMPNIKFGLYLYSILKNNKLILNYHADTRIEIQMSWKYRKKINIFYLPTYIFIPYILRSVDKLVLNSYKMAEFVKCKYQLNNEIIIPNGIDNFWFLENDVEFKQLNGEPSIFYHGRLSPEKGVDLLIRAFSKIVTKAPKAKLYISGDGPLKNNLKKLSIRYGIGKNIEFLGFLDDSELKSYLSSVTAAIYPSRYEPFSLSILEAFSTINGPVFYSKMAGIDDFVNLHGNNFNSFIPTIENIDLILNNIIENDIDNSEIINQQKEFARKFTWDKIGEQYIRLYNSMLYQ